MTLKLLSIFIEKAKSKSIKKLVVAVAQDLHVLQALKNAVALKLVEPILIGNVEEIRSIAKSISFDLTNYELVNILEPIAASNMAVQYIREKKAQILMKGGVNTRTIMLAALNKSTGIRKNKVLSQVAFFESKYYHKLLCVTDAAINITPTLRVKKAIIENAISIYHQLGIMLPKIAILSASEVVSTKMRASVHAAKLVLLNKNNKLNGCLIDGPFALDNAISKESCINKGIKGEVAGNADIVLVPNIYAGNVLYKALGFLGGATCASIIVGAEVPFVLTSRSDSEESKLYSIALAASL